VASEHEQLADFYRTIWREEKGIVYIALKEPSTKKWEQRFFEWPVEEHLVIQTTLNERASKEVYFAPAIFRERSSKKENVLGSYCFWLEFDGNLPVDLGDVPNPSMIVQTSTDTHQHLYWCLDQKVENVESIETVNKSLAYQLQADTSGWDVNQVLRPPLTLNHKKQLPAKIVAKSEKQLSSVAFRDKISIVLPPKIEITEQLPSMPDVIRKYAFDRTVWELFTKGSRDRSAGLMALGYHLAELNLTNAEILTLLIDADKRWGKFHGRDDCLKRLTEIVTHARAKYPYRINTDDNEASLVAIGDLTLRATEVNVKWLISGVLHQQGYLLLTGHTGVGKTQFCGDLANHLTLAQDFLGKAVDTSPKRVLFVSLEMGLVELKWLRGEQCKNFSEDQLKILEKNLKFLPVGYPIYYNREENRRALEELVQKGQFEVVIFDSLGSMTEQELSKETDAKLLMDWNDHLRAELGISTIIIHHHRKAQTGNKRPSSIADIYGSHYFTARATTVMTLWDPKRSGIIEVSFQKLRMSAPQKPWAIERNDDLTFKITSAKLIPQIIDDVDIDVTDATTSPVSEEFEL
jgi:hypothetical protein